MKYIISGHHNADSGAVYNGRTEAEETKKLRNALLEHFKGEKVITDRDDETNLELQRRIKPAGGSVLLDIHLNAGSPMATGVECLVNHADFKDRKSLAYRMSEEICFATATLLGINNRGVKSEKATRHGKLGILNLGAGCGVLWEVCFISNAVDMQNLDLKRGALVKKVAEILAKYDGMK